MNINIKGTNLELTDSIKNYVDEKVVGLQKYLDELLGARVELERMTHQTSGEVFRCEINIDVPQKHILRAESTEIDIYASIDTTIPKLREQIEKYKGKQRSQDRRLMRYLKSVFAWRPSFRLRRKKDHSDPSQDLTSS